MKPTADAYLLDAVKAIETRLGKGCVVAIFVFRDDGQTACASRFHLTKIMSLVTAWLSHRFDEMRMKYDS